MYTLTAGLLLALLLCLLTPTVAIGQEALYYGTYGYQDKETRPDAWTIPMRAWVYQNPDAAVMRRQRAVGLFGKKHASQIGKYLGDFIANGVEDTAVSIQFEGDDPTTRYAVHDASGHAVKSDRSGLVVGQVTLPRERAASLLQSQGSRDGWLSYRGSFQRASEVGRVRLVGDEGLSVISDIDDTIKITNIPDGYRVAFKNTFSCDFQAAPGMAAKYQSWGDASFHYVSGGLRQLYRPLSEFIRKGREPFPEGSIHLRTILVKFSAIDQSQREDMWANLTGNQEAIKQHKNGEISEIMKRFPMRRFILVGDSGESDPAIYRDIMNASPPQQIQQIIIRDVPNPRQKPRDTLEGMTTIRAEGKTGKLCDD
jgi:hypothetical protein